MFVMDTATTRARVAALRAEGRSYREICSELGLSKATVAYHARRIGTPVDEKAARRYDWPAIQRAYDGGLTVRQCADRFGFCLASWHAAVNRGAVEARPTRLTLDELLIDGRRGTNRRDLKLRLIEAGLKEDKCEGCGLVEWQGERLRPQLHHVNGEKYDNRLENLQLLCPNCHALTPNWGGRNRKRSG